ncbi:MAG: hypothetical protein QOK38_3034, partial [Acidobacteriaceae bacterium]|nr:hypothetical protein [Acidobacteriaceae bacterium]
MTKPMRIPELKSEQAEARWYDENQSALLAQLERAAKDG